MAAVEAERLSRLLSSLPVGLYACDADGRITFFNKRASELWGREPKLNDYREKFCACFKVFLPDGTFIPPEQTPMAEAIREGKGFSNIEAIVERPNGSKFTALVNIDILRDGSGVILGAINVFQEITNLKLSVEVTEQREQKLRTIVDHTPECIKLVAPDGTLLAMNGAGLCMVEADSGQQVFGQSVYDLIAPEYRGAFRAMNERVCAGSKESLTFDIIGLKGTRRNLETTAVPIPDPNGNGKVQLALTRDVTDRKRAEQALRESEEKYRALFDSIEQGFCVVEVLFDEKQKPVDYRFLLVNPAFKGQTGISNAVGRRMREIAPKHEEHWFEIYGKIALTGEAMRFENRAAQLRRDYEVYAWRVGAPEEHKVGILFTDITGRKKTEEALRQSELRWRTVTETLPNLVWSDFPDGQCDWLSSQWGTYTGIPEKELLGLKWLDRVLHPDDRERTLACWQTACADKADYDIEYRIRRHDGQYRWFKTRGVPIRNEHGKIVYWFGTCTDIEDMKQSAIVGQRLAAIIESSDDAIMTKDLNGIILSWNNGAERIFGYTADEVIGKSITVLMPPERINEETAIIDRIRRGERVDHYETVRRRKDGKLLDISLTISPLKDASGIVIGASKVARDITDTVRAKENLEATVAERTASLMDAIAQMEEFSYTVSHDLRAPLRGMKVYSEALLKDYAPSLPKDAYHWLQRISSNAKLLDKMILDVLTFSRVARTDLKLERVALYKLVRQILEQYPGMQSPKAEIQIEPLPDVLGHEPSLTQAFSNLISNAVKFVGPNITPKVRIWSERNDGQVRVCVADNGIGVDPKYQHRLFRMFERLHPYLNYDGTGVGLAIVRKAVDRIGGKVGVESDGINGSMFWFEVPAAE
jgi:PAS domain S-box-containing protein